MLRSIQQLEQFSSGLLFRPGFLEIQFRELIVEFGRGIVEITSQMFEVSYTSFFIRLLEESDDFLTRESFNFRFIRCEYLNVSYLLCSGDSYAHLVHVLDLLRISIWKSRIWSSDDPVPTFADIE
jgi:hypothetical protein